MNNFDNTDQNNEPPTVDCGCGNTVYLYNTLENECRECGLKYSGTGQRLNDTWRRDARRRGSLRSDPGVGRPGY